MLPFNLNNAVDELLKREFDLYRKKQEVHPLLKIHQIDAKLFDHPNLDEWRENFKGITFLHSPTQFLLTGAVDDVWINSKNELIIVDYKATSKEIPITKTEELYSAYKRQMEFYQWLFAKNGFSVSPMGYFVYCNGMKNKPDFRRHLEFQVHLIPYTGSNEWIEPILDQIHQVLQSEQIPQETSTCEYCKYANLLRQI
jgi:RecB family exonuclease